MLRHFRLQCMYYDVLAKILRVPLHMCTHAILCYLHVHGLYIVGNVRYGMDELRL